MIEFKTKYTLGPWCKMDGWSVHKKYGSRICEIIPWKIEGDNDLAKFKLFEDVANTNLIVNAPQIAEYMMGRAKELHEEINMYHCNPSSWVDEDIKKDTINELQVILSTLKDAGIEVVEK